MQGVFMTYPENTETKENTDVNRDRHLIPDDATRMENSDDDQVPRVKGLIELLNQYFVKKSG